MMVKKGRGRQTSPPPHFFSLHFPVLYIRQLRVINSNTILTMAKFIKTAAKKCFGWLSNNKEDYAWEYWYPTGMVPPCK